MVAMTAALLATVDDEPAVAEDNALIDHPEEPLMAADDALLAPEDDALMVVGDSLMALEDDTLMVVDILMAAVDTASVVVVVAIPMISLVQCQYFVVFLYFGTGFDTDHI
jgi:hypothetical protein